MKFNVKRLEEIALMIISCIILIIVNRAFFLLFWDLVVFKLNNQNNFIICLCGINKKSIFFLSSLFITFTASLQLLLPVLFTFLLYIIKITICSSICTSECLQRFYHDVIYQLHNARSVYNIAFYKRYNHCLVYRFIIIFFF